MFVMVAYDVPAKRTEKYRKTLSRFLLSAQFSVFLGDLTEVQYRILHRDLNGLHKESDRVLIVITENRRNIRVVRWEDAGEKEETNHLGSLLL